MSFLRKSPSALLCTRGPACSARALTALVLCFRFLLSLASCKKCLVIDDQLNILPISSHAAGIEALPPQAPVSWWQGPCMCEGCVFPHGGDKPLLSVFR